MFPLSNIEPAPVEPPLHTESDLLAFLDWHGIHYQRVEHPPVLTCAEAERFRPKLPAISTKNLFLRSGEPPNGPGDQTSARRYYLVMTACEKRLDLKGLSTVVSGSLAGKQGRLHFGSPEELLACLGVTPGSVTILGLANDIHHWVSLLIDTQYWSQDYYLCHPLVNTATLVLARTDLLRFCEITGHAPAPIDMPAG